ncbi:MAG: hypothetical protein RIS54_1960, partial [Verrucomicrobiota bacterium]
LAVGFWLFVVWGQGVAAAAPGSKDKSHRTRARRTRGTTP